MFANIRSSSYKGGRGSSPVPPEDEKYESFSLEGQTEGVNENIMQIDVLESIEAIQNMEKHIINFVHAFGECYPEKTTVKMAGTNVYISNPTNKGKRRYSWDGSFGKN